MIAALSSLVNPTESAHRRKLLWIELCIMAPCLVLTSFLASFGSSRTVHDIFYLVSNLSYDVGRMALIFFVVWVADGDLRTLGFNRPQWLRDLGWAALLIAFGVLWVGIVTGPSHGALSTKAAAQAGASSEGLVRLIVSIAKSIKDLIVLAYFVGRLSELVRQQRIAVVLVAILCALPYLALSTESFILQLGMNAACAYVLASQRRISILFIMTAVLSPIGAVRLLRAGVG